MASHHRTLRAAAVVCTAVAVAGPAPVAAWAATAPAAAPYAPPAPYAAPYAGPHAAGTGPAAAPSPDPFADLTPQQIADRAVTATQSASSLRMTGKVVTDGQHLDVDFTADDRGDCTGTIRIDDGTAELRRLDTVSYMKGDEAFWRLSMASQGIPENQIDATLELVKGRWLKIAPGQSGSGDLSEICDLDSLLSDLDDDESRDNLTRGRDGEVDGTPVATLVDKKRDGETTTVSVAQEGKPYIRKVVRTGGDEPGSMTLSAYDKPVKVTAPPADETVDLSRLDPGSRA